MRLPSIEFPYQITVRFHQLLTGEEFCSNKYAKNSSISTLSIDSGSMQLSGGVY